MNNFVFNFMNESDEVNSLSIDELFEKKQKQDLETLKWYNKILNKIHKKIKEYSLKSNFQYCTYQIPSFVFGLRNYNQNDCIAYIIKMLTDSKFYVEYREPNTIIISWSHFIPTYVRNEFKKKTGIEIDEFGNKINKNENNDNYKNDIFSQNKTQQNNKKEFMSTKDYKPSGKMVYDNELLDKISSKLNN